jgi:uncharacterized repeat protein (TIGR01451 family)
MSRLRASAAGASTALLCALPLLVRADAPYLVRDINPDIVAGAAQASAAQYTPLGSRVLFSACDSHRGCELWRTDGTAAGTALLRDINPIGNADSFPFPLTRVGAIVLFGADDGVHGGELWRSDGTATGTVLVEDIAAGPASSVNFTNMVAAGGLAFFPAAVGTDVELWRSDGTADGTFRVKDIYPGPTSSVPENLVDVGGTLYFTARDPASGVELWKSDGTPAGTVKVADIQPGPASSSPQRLVNVAGTLFFVANDGIHGIELWKSDGTASGTVIVKDIRPGPLSPSFGAMAGVAGTLFFAADDGTTGLELWKSDGTPAGTVFLKDIYPGPFSSNLDMLTDLGGTLFFWAADDLAGLEPWTSDGTESGTVLVKDIHPAGSAGAPASVAVMNGSIFFAADDGTAGLELWRSDGTEGGTTLVKDINPGPAHGSPTWLAAIDGTLFLTASDGTGGPSTWTSDGTEAGTVRLGHFGPTQPSSPTHLTDVNGTLFFAACERHHFIAGSDCELWKSDGTEAGTVRVKDINPGPAGSFPTFLVDVGDTLYFHATDPDHGTELWKSDGTEAGTVRVKDINPGPPSALSFFSFFPQDPVVVDGILFFGADDGTNGIELWRSDGTEAGTVLVKDIRPGPESSQPVTLTASGGRLLFWAFDDDLRGSELWRSDGTESGTVLVKDIYPGVSSSTPTEAVDLDGTLLFAADGPLIGKELWRSDGTEAGTVLVEDIAVLGSSSSPRDLTKVGAAVFFVASTDTEGTELWKSDGTAAGTVLVRDIRPDLAPLVFNPSLTAAGDTLFFVADDGVHGPELWRSDGTEAGTVLVQDIQPDTFGIPPTELASANGVVFFHHLGAMGGFDMWRSDGTPAGTRLVDVNPGPAESSPLGFTLSGSRVFFSATNGTSGQELWALPLAPELFVSPPSVDFGGRRIGTGPSAPSSVQIQNAGTSPLTVTSVVLGGSAPSSFGVSGWVGMPVTLAPGEGLGLSVTFNPASLGPKSATITVASDDPADPDEVVTLSGVGTSAEIGTSTTSLDFGDVDAGGSADLPLTIFNNGTASLTIGSLAISGPQAGDFSLVSPPATPFAIAASDSQGLTVRCAPTSTGTRSATLTITSDDDDTPVVNVSLTCTGVDPSADLSIVKSDGVGVAFPGQAISYTITAGNAGPSPVTGATVTDALPAALTGANWTCVGAGGGACTASGAGSIADSVDLPVGASVTYTLTATVSASAAGTLSNTAAVAPPGGVTDPVPVNDTATDTDAVIACGSELVVVPDGRLARIIVPAGATVWIGARVRIGNSYSVELESTTGTVPPGTLTVFSGDDACGGTSTLATTDTAAADPAGSGGAVRRSFTATGTLTDFRARLENSAGGPVTVGVSWSDTTMFSPAWSDFGSFDTFYSFQNTTGETRHGTLTLLSPAGAEVGTSNLTIAAGQTASTNTQAMGIARNQVGTARFTHDGPPGAILAEAAIANFSISPAYVQPVKLQAMREAAH